MKWYCNEIFLPRSSGCRLSLTPCVSGERLSSSCKIEESHGDIMGVLKLSKNI